MRLMSFKELFSLPRDTIIATGDQLAFDKISDYAPTPTCLYRLIESNRTTKTVHLLNIMSALTTGIKNSDTARLLYLSEASFAPALRTTEELSNINHYSKLFVVFDHNDCKWMAEQFVPAQD
jgi:hypothetical protein